MKMVKSLLLGSAAGLVAIASAQAADLPVKAKPVQYVKICSLYGAGFYYIPGTDICLKVGGWVRAEYTYGSNGNIASGTFNANTNNRITNDSTWRSRAYITADARSQTAYGTVRSYLAVGLNDSDVNGTPPGFNANRAFIQWAGFTFGTAQSFFDFYNLAATSYWGVFPASDTGDPGWKVAAYTAQFGGGFSATISAEMRRQTQLIGPGSGALVGAYGTAAGFSLNGAYGGFQSPDIVAALRVDQAWGSAQIMGALHQVNATYYGGNASTAANQGTGHPGDTWGYAVGAGIKLNAPMIGPGDYFQAQVNYAEGASRYIFSSPNNNWGYVQGANTGFGVLSDGVYGGTVAAGTATNVELTKTWGFNAAYEHFWNPAWRTSVYGGYAAVRYGSVANNMLCSAGGLAAGSAAPAVAGCDNNWSTYWVGSRTQWNVSKDFYMGLDVLYQNLKTATNPNVVAIANTANMDNWAFRFRVHRDFMP